MKAWCTVVIVSLLGVACSSTPSLTEYAERVEELVVTMNFRIDAADALVDAEPTVENLRWSANDRVAARNQFLEGFGALDPPGEVADLHEAAFGIVTRLAAAEADFARLAEQIETAEDAEDLWNTPEGRAARAVDVEAFAICEAAQAELDATAGRETLSGVPWIPREMKEVVQVAFRCSRDER